LQTSKVLNQLVDERMIWFNACISISSYQPLSLPSGRSASNCNMTELKFAAIRAHGLYRTLRLDSKDGPIRSKEPFKALCAGPPEAHERVLLYRGIPGGQYLAVFVGCNLRLWDIAKGKCLGELEFEAELALWEMHVVKSDPGNETLILVVHESPWDPLTLYVSSFQRSRLS
jgi:hypothetical protein